VQRFYDGVRLLVKGGHGPPLISPKLSTSRVMSSSLHIGRKVGYAAELQKYASAFGLGQKNRHRSAAGSQRRHAVGRVEDPQLQAISGLPARQFRGDLGQGA